MVQPSRNLLAAVLAVTAAVATVAAALALYLRFEVGDRDAFADHTAAAFDRPEVRRVVAREVVVELVDRGSTDLVSARPVLEGVVEALIGTPPFERLSGPRRRRATGCCSNATRRRWCSTWPTSNTLRNTN